jgi:hypothetical protein
MTERRILWVLSLLILGFALNPAMPLARAQATAPAPASAGAESLRAATVLTIHGTITAIDKAEKLVTIQVPGGKTYPLKVENPYNLDAASVGAGVVVRYYEAVTVRKKKAGESLPALSVSGGVVTAKAGTPGAVAEEHLKAVVSVVQVDKANGTVTIKGADGSIETAKANNPKVLSDLKPGDDLVITASRATAISLDKEPAK